MINIEKTNSKRIKAFQNKLLLWGKNDLTRFPWRTKNKSFHSLIVEILLQRTKAEQVVPVYRQFKREFPSALSLSKARIKTVEKIIYSLGLKWRAGNLVKLGKELQNKYRGRAPLRIDDLLKLPGVGPYAAGAFLSLHSGIRAIIPDANMARILGRFFGFPVHSETRREKKFLILCDQVTPEMKFLEFNYAIIDYGRKICLPKNPLCSTCSLKNSCSLLQKPDKTNMK